MAQAPLHPKHKRSIPNQSPTPQNTMNIHKDKLSPVTRVSLDSIVTDGRFQTRRVENLIGAQKTTARELSKKHIDELAQQIRNLTETVDNPSRDAHLRPLIVWQPKGAAVYHIVSGFHRYAAYLWFNKKYAPNKRQKKRAVPVQIFSGSQEDALLLSAHQDIKPNIPKTTEQKANSAWELIRTENKAAAQLTAKELAIQTGLNKSTVDRMRQAFKKLKAEGRMIHVSWRAQQFAMRANQPAADPEEQILKKLSTMKKQILSKYLRDGLRNDAGLFDRLLVMIKNDIEAKQEEQLQDDLQYWLQDEPSDITSEEDEPEEYTEEELKELLGLTLLTYSLSMMKMENEYRLSPELARLVAILSLSGSQQKSVVIETLMDLIDLAD
jgi:hypothetical protein